ncbi:MAG: SDR family NAD(P)-dependent oxidoreductase, partial [Verrucomicrobia subdivision 3 bacterium]|nr:SDR family NAD(P)-dependent oxidoreductase [Limisphaerales bacterium]
MKKQSVVLVTGASSGIGRAITESLVQEGMMVFGASRYPDRVTPVAGVEYVGLDVRSEDSVRACVNEVIERAGRMEVLINNAGYELGGAIEETTLEEAQTQFETNFFGVARVIKAVLPAMRERGSGHIINMSSVVGWLVPAPFLGYYAASKMALEAYTEVLRHEVVPFGVKVSLIEPSFINTNLGSNRQMAAESIRAYAPWQRRAFGVIEHREQTAPPPRLVAATVLQAIRQSHPRPRYTVGEGVWGLSFIRRFLPWFAYERGIRSFFNLDERGGLTTY